MNDIDKYLHEIIKNDELAFGVDPSSIHRLKNHLRLVTLRSSARLNSIVSFNLKKILPLTPVKIGIACCLIIAFIGLRQINSNSEMLIKNDSTYINTLPDTTINMLFTDTIKSSL
jgi:hypothetical protein